MISVIQLYAGICYGIHHRYAHHHSCPSTSCMPNRVLRMSGTADGDATSHCHRSLVGQAVFIVGQTSRCCMVCLMPQSQYSASLEHPHFNMFILDWPTCVRNRLRAFQVVQGFSAPAGRCSSALMLRCTLASRGSSRSLHCSMRAAFAFGLMGSSAISGVAPLQDVH